MIHAIVMINAQADRIPEAAQEIADLEGVDRVYSCAGDIDLIAMVNVRDHPRIAEVVTRGINRVEGVVNTRTHIAFASYASSDIEAAFSLGSDD